MERQATLTIPHPLYEQARRVAQTQQQDVDELIAELLVRHLPTVDTALPTDAQAREIEAFEQMHPQLLAQIAGEYAAIVRAELVDHDADSAVLLHRIEQQFPDEFVLIRPVRQEAHIVYDHRAVRWG